MLCVFAGETMCGACVCAIFCTVLPCALKGGANSVWDKSTLTFCVATELITGLALEAKKKNSRSVWL